jgi:hypothetical protein
MQNSKLILSVKKDFYHITIYLVSNKIFSLATIQTQSWFHSVHSRTYFRKKERIHFLSELFIRLISNNSLLRYFDNVHSFMNNFAH